MQNLMCLTIRRSNYAKSDVLSTKYLKNVESDIFNHKLSNKAKAEGFSNTSHDVHENDNFARTHSIHAKSFV
jgi:hypothetical protein